VGVRAVSRFAKDRVLRAGGYDGRVDSASRVDTADSFGVRVLGEEGGRSLGLGARVGMGEWEAPKCLGRWQEEKGETGQKLSNGKKRAVSKVDAEGEMLGRKGVERSLACAEHAVRPLREYYEVIGFGTRGHDFLESCERRMSVVVHRSIVKSAVSPVRCSLTSSGLSHNLYQKPPESAQTGHVKSFNSASGS